MVPNVWQTQQHKVTFASVASNGANAALGERIGPMNFDGRIRDFRVVFTGAGQGTVGTATSTATYRRLTLLNGGTSGTGTTILASVNLNGASIASLSSGKAGSVVYPATGTAASSGTFGSTDMLWCSQLTVGGTNDDATVLAAGYVLVTVESIG